MIKVSVVVPAYNVEKYLKRCIDSITKQDLQEIQILIVNDGSTDTTGTVADELAMTDDRITVIHTENRGLSQARNAGVEVCVGEYLTFVDSDDYLLPGALSGMYGLAKADDLDVLCCTAIEEGKNGSNKEYRFNPPHLALGVRTGVEFFANNYKLNSFFITAWAKVVKLSFLRSIDLSFYPRLYHEDLLWTPQLMFAAKRVSGINLSVYYYYYNNQSITNSTRLAKLYSDRMLIYTELERIVNALDNERYRVLFLSWFAREYMYYAGSEVIASSEYSTDVNLSYVKGKFSSPFYLLLVWIFMNHYRLFVVMMSLKGRLDRALGNR